MSAQTGGGHTMVCKSNSPPSYHGRISKVRSGAKEGDPPSQARVEYSSSAFAYSLQMVATDARYCKCQFSRICFCDKTNKVIRAMALIHSCDSSEGPLQPCKQKSERQTDRQRVVILFLSYILNNILKIL